MTLNQSNYYPNYFYRKTNSYVAVKVIKNVEKYRCVCSFISKSICHQYRHFSNDRRLWCENNTFQGSSQARNQSTWEDPAERQRWKKVLIMNNYADKSLFVIFHCMRTFAVVRAIPFHSGMFLQLVFFGLPMESLNSRRSFFKPFTEMVLEAQWWRKTKRL